MKNMVNIINENIFDKNKIDYSMKYFIKNSNNIEYILDNINEKFPYLILKYYSNISIVNLLPIELEKRNNVIFQNVDYLNNINHSNVINLNNEDIYVVLHNIYNHHFYNTLQEYIANLEIYLLYFKKFKIICDINDYNSLYFKLVREYFNIEDKNILVINHNDSTIYNGNFLYLHIYPKYKDCLNLITKQIPYIFNKYNNIQNRQYLNCYKNISYENSKWMNINEKIIINRFIEEANKLYKNNTNIKLYDKIWISRRNLDINTYRHKRFITNINDIVPVLEKNNFKELILEDNLIDFLEQIYIINNASIIFSEMGTGFCNVHFMKENTTWITTNYPVLEDFLIGNTKSICDYKNVNLYVYYDIVEDINNPYYNFVGTWDNKICPNLPIKFSDTNDFILWFDNILYNNKNKNKV